MTPSARPSSRLLLSLAVVLLSRPAVRADTAATDSIRQALDVAYGREERQTLDVYAPRGAKGAPVVLFVHGGGWVFGDKNFHGRYRPGCRHLASQGLVTVAVNDRLSPRVRHPEHVKDVARAFAWVRRHAGDYGGDPERIVLLGHSAGAHLAALLATADADWKDDGLGLGARDRKALRGVASLSGVYRIPAPDEFAVMAREMLSHRLMDSEGRPRVPPTLVPIFYLAGERANLFHLVFGSDAGACKDASPLTHVRPGLPPFLLLSAERELPLLADMAVEFEKALKKADVPVRRRQIDGSNHHNIMLTLSRPDDEVAAELLRFLDRCTGPPARKKP